MKDNKDSKKEQEIKEKAKGSKETQEEKKDEKVSEEEILKMKVETLEKDNADLKDQMIRRQADLENFRKRLIREKEEAVQFANSKLISDLLEFMDNLERTISAAKTGSDVKAICDGIEMIQSQLLSALDKNWGLKKIDSVGKEFNPQEHEACMMAIDSSLETETVLEEFQTGYKLHERVIRPAKVKVGKPE